MLNLRKVKQIKIVNRLNKLKKNTIVNENADEIAKDILINEKSIKIEKLCCFALLVAGVGIAIYNLDAMATESLFKNWDGGLIPAIKSKINSIIVGIDYKIFQQNELGDFALKMAEIFAPLYLAHRFKNAYEKDKFENKILKGEHKQGQGFIRSYIHAHNEKTIDKKIKKANKSLEKTKKNINNKTVDDKVVENKNDKAPVIASNTTTTKVELKTDNNLKQQNDAIEIDSNVDLPKFEVDLLDDVTATTSKQNDNHNTKQMEIEISDNDANVDDIEEASM